MWEDDDFAELEDCEPLDRATLEDLGLSFSDLDPEPSDETEAFYRRSILGERFLGDN
jgi:hypothetical protein